MSTVRSLSGRARRNISVVDLHEKILSSIVRKGRPDIMSIPVYVKLRGALSKPTILLRCLNASVGGPKRVKSPKWYL
jgi:hypothetical protein